MIKHETCIEYVIRRLSEGWKIISHSDFKVILQSPEGIIRPVDLRYDTEEQLTNDSNWSLYAGANIRVGQYLTISNREVTKLSFLLKRVGTSTGDVTFTIRKVSDDSIIASKVWGDGYDLSTMGTWREVTFDSPVTINEAVRISVEYSGGDSDNYVIARYQSTDVKADELLTNYVSSWTAYGDNDIAYIYTYTPPAPDPPTNVDATDGAHTDKVVITWTKSAGATKYEVFRDGVGLGELGDVATHDDTGADAPTITAGDAVASDGTSADHVSLNLTGEGTSNGTTHTYKVKAGNAGGWSGDSGTNTGYRGVGTLTYQWQRSAADSDEDYSNIDGATTEAYNDTGAPEDGSRRYYQCIENATGAAEQTSTSNRGYRIAAGWTGKIGGVTNPAKVGGVAKEDIKKIGGVE